MLKNTQSCDNVIQTLSYNTKLQLIYVCHKQPLPAIHTLVALNYLQMCVRLKQNLCLEYMYNVEGVLWACGFLCQLKCCNW